MQFHYVECPRDSWQGLSQFIPTERKIAYLQALLDAGFRRLDMGSFVSPKAVPQMAHTEAVLAELDVPEGTDLLAIIANGRGLERALAASNLRSVGYPLSVNETFQLKNTRMTLDASWLLVADLAELTRQSDLDLVVYLSMGFGNPYGEPWQARDTAAAVMRLRELGITRIALADTVGTASPERLADVLGTCSEPEKLGLHLHARPDAWQSQLEKALEFELSWFEGALAGIGGCPFAKDELVGNLPTEKVLTFLADKGYDSVSQDKLTALSARAFELATTYH